MVYLLHHLYLLLYDYPLLDQNNFIHNYLNYFVCMS